MPEFTIVAAAHKRDLPPKEGMRPSQVIALTLDDGTTRHEAEWITATTTDDASLVGTRISGTLEPSQYGLRFKKDRAFGGGGGRGRSPEESAAIQRQHSQGVAVALLHVKAVAGKLTDDDLTPAKIRALTDHFDDDIAAGVERKHPSQAMSKGLPVRNEPERTGNPDFTPEPYPEPAPVGGDVPFSEAS